MSSSGLFLIGNGHCAGMLRSNWATKRGAGNGALFAPCPPSSPHPREAYEAQPSMYCVQREILEFEPTTGSIKHAGSRTMKRADDIAVFGWSSLNHDWTPGAARILAAHRKAAGALGYPQPGGANGFGLAPPRCRIRD
jgi:hypothetical protein